MLGADGADASPGVPCGMTLPPFATREVLRRLDTLLEAGRYPDLNHTRVGLLRALIGLADWKTGAIPASRAVIAAITLLDVAQVYRYRVELCAMGLLVERWRSGLQVQYGLTDALRSRVRNKHSRNA